MSRQFTVEIRDRQRQRTHRIMVPEDRYILQTAEAEGIVLPFSCRNGCCTTCAVRVLEGDLAQPEALGLSLELRGRGYALLCVSYPCSDLVVETQDEDEVYELQFGRHFGRGRLRRSIPLEEE